MLAGEFTHVVFKRLSAVEADRSRSNQHEFNAPKTLRDAFGGAQPRRIDTDFIWMPDNGDFIAERGDLTWYDSRARHPTRSEYRVYYRDNAVTRYASAGALLLIALRPDDTVLLVLAPGTGLAAARISWLFGIEALPGSGFAALDIDPAAGRKLTSQLGMSPDQQLDGWEEETGMVVGKADGEVRRQAADAQHKIAGVTVSEAQWDDIVLSFPAAPPAEIAGAGFGHTVRGVIAPRS